MILLNRKEKELMELLERIIHQYALNKERPGVDICRKPEIKLVEILGKNGSPKIMTEIASQADLPLSTVTGIIDGLVLKGLVQRERSDEDRRIVRVDLTDEGRKIYEEVLEVRSSIVRGMLGALNRNEQESLVDLFRKIVSTIQREKKGNVDKLNNSAGGSVG